MRTLFLTPQLPYPPSKGTTLRNYNLIKYMAPRHEIHLLSFTESAEEITGSNPLRSLCKSVQCVPQPPTRSPLQRLGSTLLSPLPDMALRLPSNDFRQKLARLVSEERFDVVQIEGIEMAQFIDVVHASAHPLPTIIFDEHNAEYVLQRRAFETDSRLPLRWPGAVYSLVQWQKLKRYEETICRRAKAVVAVSEADRRALQSLDPTMDVTVVSNGIDVGFFQDDCKDAQWNARGADSANESLVFVGTMDYRPNVDAMVWFCRDVFPLISRKMPELRLQIVGRSATKAVREAAGRNVDIVGGVDDVRPYIRRSAVYVVPMRIGGGVRFKVLEAMACNIPVVSTRVGAEGIDVNDGEHLLLAEEPADFAAKVVSLLRSPDRGRAMARRAEQRVTSLYDWRVIAPRLEEVWLRHAKQLDDPLTEANCCEP